MSLDTENLNERQLLEKHTKLLEENNKLLRKLYRFTWWGFWTKLLWFAALVGLPFALYFYVLQPYFEALGSSYETFYMGMQEIPGVKQFNEALEYYKTH